MDELIKEMQEKGLISIAPLRFQGKANAVLEFLSIMATTDPMETDLNWWGLRMFILNWNN